MSLSRPRRGREEGDGDGRAGGEEDQRGSTPAKRPRRYSCSCSCCQEIKDFYEGQTEILRKEMQSMSKGFVEERKAFQRKMQEFYQNSQLQFREQISERVKQLIREQFNTFISEINTPRDCVREDSNFRTLSHQNNIRTYRLKFDNKCSNDKYSGKVIMADDGNPIKVAIYDHDNKIIVEGPLSSMRVKVVVLDGEFNKENKEQWSKSSFVKSILYGRTGRSSLFANELYLRLEGGVANLCGIKFQDNSSFVPSKKFKLGVMAVDDSISEEILEGISEAFSVKDGRGFPTKKDSCPALSDPVYKLKQIGVKGVRREKLEQMHINLVQDFLWFYNKDKDSLRKACGKISDHDWDVIVEHALSCKPGHECYSYHIPEMNATIFFNSLYNIVGAEFNGKYTLYEELDETQKGLVEVSRTRAYDNLKVVQNGDKDPCHDHEMTTGNKGSCSMLPSPTLPTKFHGLENDPAKESPRLRQQWRTLKTVVCFIFGRSIKKPLAETSIGTIDMFGNINVEPETEMFPAPSTESIGMTDIFGNSVLEPETSYSFDLGNIAFEDWNTF